MIDKKTRQRISPEKKYEIVKDTLMGKGSVSEVCRKHGISTSMFYKWQQKFFDGALQALKSHENNEKLISKREEKLLQENQRLKAVISELAAENLELKKSLGD